MSARCDIAKSVLDTAVRYYLPPSEIAELINNIFNNLDWDNRYPYTIEDVIVAAKSIVNDKYSSSNKKAYNKWLELHGE